MNHFYTFIGERVDEHFNTHLQNLQRGIALRLEPQHYCYICYPPSDNPSNEIANFFHWIEERGAISGSITTE